MLIVYVDEGVGWSPITHMVYLMTSMFNAKLLMLNYNEPTTLTKLEAVLFKKQLVKEHRNNLILICPSAKHLNLLLQLKGYRKRFDFVAAWVIDSFWIDRVPKWVGLSNHFDHIFITTEEDIECWSTMFNCPVSWLPWGSDVIGMGGAATERSYDLLRVGRQPVEWENDVVTESDCKAANIRFHGRPNMVNNPQKNQQGLMTLYQQTKFLLAFSNLANPAKYTHPTRSYLTGRWVDALACGAIVAGISPKEKSVKRLLWDGAILELGSINRVDGLEKVIDALMFWTPERAFHNYHQSLKYLDWRWRFVEIAKVFKIDPIGLGKDLSLLRAKINTNTLK